MSKSVRISSTVTPQVDEAINALLWQGLHGATRSQVVARLLCQAVELNIVRGHLSHEQLNEPKPKGFGGEP